MDTCTPGIVDRAVDFAGGPVALARFCCEHDGRRVTYQGVQKWAASNRVPGERCIGVAKATGGRIAPHELRPDIFPRGAFGESAA